MFTYLIIGFKIPNVSYEEIILFIFNKSLFSFINCKYIHLSIYLTFYLSTYLSIYWR